MSAPDLLALVLCDVAAIDDAGKVSLHGLFDCIWAAGFPTRHPQLAVFWKARFPEPGAARVVVEGPNGQPIALTDRVDVPQAGLAQAIHVINAVEFPVPGEYLVRLIADQGQIGVTSLDVRVRQ